MRFDRRLLLTLAVPILILATLAARGLRSNSETSPCQAPGLGQSAAAAAAAYVRACGSGYSLSGGGTPIAAQSGYAEVERFRVSDHGQIILVLVGRHIPDGTWSTFSLETLR